jgi:predicted RecB family nuclease
MKINKKNIIEYSPQDLLKFLDSTFVSWMDRKLLDDPLLEEKKDKEEETSTQKMLFKEGNMVERILTDKIKNANSKDFVSINIKYPDPDSHESDTLFSMETGAKYIYQAFLKHENFSGYADILVRVDNSKSKFGNFSYTVKDIKRSQVAKGKFILQICAYCDLLEKIQGTRPEKAYIILGNGEEEEFLVNDYFDYYLNSKKEFLNFQKNFSDKSKPNPLLRQNNSVWKNEAKTALEKTQDISLIANIEKEEIKKLKEVKISTIDDLLDTNENISQLNTDLFNKLKLQAKIQREKTPIYIKLEHNIESPKGLQNLPPSNDKDVFLDIQWSESLEKDSFIFLFNLAYKNEQNEWAFEKIEAYKKEFEEKTLKRFLATVRKKIEQEGRIFYFNKELPEKLIQVSSEYDTGLSFFQELIFKNRLIDLSKTLTQSLVLAVDVYDINSVSQFTKEPFHYKDTEETFFSLIRFAKIESHRELAKKEYNNIILTKIRSLIAIYEWCQELQKKEGLEYIPLTDRAYYKTKQEIEEEDDGEIEIKEDSLSNIDFFEFDLSTYKTATIDDKILTLIKQLKKFHAHENRPRQIDKQELLEQEASILEKHPRCLAYLAFLKIDEKDDSVFIYRFNPKQETKIKENDSFIVRENKMIKGKVIKIDSANAIIYLKIPKKRIKYLKKYNIISIIEDSFLPQDGIENSIKKVSQEVSKEKENLGLNKCLYDFLTRSYPDISGIEKGSDLYNENEDLIRQAEGIISKMNNTTLIIQGPPGAGKTHTSSKIIESLVNSGKKIGISSNSHKAINNLLLKIKEINPKAKIAKLGGDDSELSDEKIQQISDKEYGENKNYFNIVGGTVFKFCKEVYENEFDYLFIDEAGQVSLANLVAMSKSCKNLVLIGDQMQLEQPIQALHPGDSGKSILEYYLGEHKTIPKSLGFFLPVTRRMNPNLCKIVSENFYDSKLVSHDSTKEQYLILNNNKYIHKNAGLQFVPVWHEDNNQYSDEELEMIEQLVVELKTQKLKVKDTEKDITDDDIIIVSPYNMQVRKIQEKFPKIKAGSVDLFQGQEAPVVIISLASSSGGGRGIEFLLSENRLNVAISRGQCLALLVASPNIAKSQVNKLKELQLINIFCRLMQE